MEDKPDKQKNIDHDGLFKELLTTFFREFMEAFFPEVHELLDYTYLELLTQEIITDVALGEKKYIDILVKTRLLGEEGFILIHVEPQAEKQSDFAERMYRYYSRLYLKYNQRILPIAVLSHGTKKPEPSKFEITFSFHDVLLFKFKQLHLKRKNWRDYLKQNNPASAALMSCMNYTEKEKKKLKAEFLRMITRFKLDPARMQLLIGFFETYLILNDEEEKEVQQMLQSDLETEEVKKVAEILTSYHKRGMQEGLQKTLILLSMQKLGSISPETERRIQETESIPVLEKALEKVFYLESEETLLNLLN